MKDRKAGIMTRLLEPGDADAVARLCVQLGYPRTGEEIGRWVEGWRERTATQTVFVAVTGEHQRNAESEEEIAGWIEVSLVSDLQRPGYALIGGLVVADGVRGLGVGRRLREEAEAWSWAKGVQMIRVTSRSSREGAHRFYLRDGYQQIKMSMVFEKRRPEESGA